MKSSLGEGAEGDGRCCWTCGCGSREGFVMLCIRRCCLALVDSQGGVPDRLRDFSDRCLATAMPTGMVDDAAGAGTTAAAAAGVAVIPLAGGTAPPLDDGDNDGLVLRITALPHVLLATVAVAVCICVAVGVEADGWMTCSRCSCCCLRHASGIHGTVRLHPSISLRPTGAASSSISSEGAQVSPFFSSGSNPVGGSSDFTSCLILTVASKAVESAFGSCPSTVTAKTRQQETKRERERERT